MNWLTTHAVKRTLKMQQSNLSSQPPCPGNLFAKSFIP